MVKRAFTSRLLRMAAPSGEAFVELCAEKDVSNALNHNNEHMGRRYVEDFQGAEPGAIGVGLSYGGKSWWWVGRSGQASWVTIQVF